MTHKEWIRLSELDQRIVVATLSGKYHSDLRSALPNNVSVTHGMEILDFANVPDYIQDLNAMHSAEQILNTMQSLRYPTTSAWNVYRENLSVLVNDTDWVSLWSATAAQRAEAFVLTMSPE